MSVKDMIEEIETHVNSYMPVYGLDDDMGKRIITALRAAARFVEQREEANDSIWYCNGDDGRELLKALGIPYVEKS